MAPMMGPVWGNGGDSSGGSVWGKRGTRGHRAQALC
jgi:hypothetical protein